MISKGSGGTNSFAKVDAEFNLLLVGLEGFTLKDLAHLYPGLNIAIHVKDGEKWVPVTIEDLRKG